MNIQNLFYLVIVTQFFTIIYGINNYSINKYRLLTKITTYKDAEYYCKDNICVSTKNRKDFDTIIIPNKEGKNITYIIDTCSPLDISLDLCNSINCTDDSQCLSNKCMEGHCSFNEDNPIVHCQYVRISKEAHFYKIECGKPRGDKCKSDKDCSSRNCVQYTNNKICEHSDDNGCTSLCGFDIIIVSLICFYLPILLIICCSCCCIYRIMIRKPKKKLQKTL